MMPFEMNTYAVWFIGFMLAFGMMCRRLDLDNIPLTERALFVSLAVCVGSWATLFVLCVQEWARINHPERFDDED